MKKTFYLLSVIFAFSFLIVGCDDDDKNTTQKVIGVKVKTGELYTYSLPLGDEDGAIISVQAQNYEISEIRINEEDALVREYCYKSKADFEGNDYVELIVTRNSVGTPEYSKETIIKIKLEVVE